MKTRSLRSRVKTRSLRSRGRPRCAREDARRVADRLAIPFYALNLDAEFSRIIDYFVDEYAAGRTPNPCVQCNNWIKFGKLFDYAKEKTAKWASVNRDEKQTPILLPTSGGTDRAVKLELATVGTHAAPAPPPLAQPEKTPAGGGMTGRRWPAA